MRLIVKAPVWDDMREIGQRIANDNTDVADSNYLSAATTLPYQTNFFAMLSECSLLKWL